MSAWVQGQRWMLAYTAALVTWVATAFVFSDRGGTESLIAAATLAVFSVIVGLGQMVVIGAGNGNVDLSIPSTMTLAAYLSVGPGGSGWGSVAQVIVLGVLSGAAVGIVNATVILLLRIPAIIATLAVGYGLQSITLAYAHAKIDVPNPLLAQALVARVAGLPLLTFVAVGLTLAMAALLRRTAYGRSVLAIGQNARAAYLAGIKIGRTVVITYLISGMLAGLAGVLLAAFAGGAALDLATSFLLTSIAIVVLGGSSIAGGSVSVAGTWGAALFLALLQNLLNLAHLAAGWQYISEGLVIVLVLTLFSRPAADRP